MRKLFCLLVLCGCATSSVVPIDYSVSPPVDWPKLDERLTYADFDTVQRWCNVHKVAPGRKVVGCAVVNFEFNLCMIYLSDKNEEHLAHERAHCSGYGHVGNADSMSRGWESYKKTGKTTYQVTY